MKICEANSEWNKYYVRKGFVTAGELALWACIELSEDTTGADWDSWDEYYKNACYSSGSRPNLLGKMRDIIAKG